MSILSKTWLRSWFMHPNIDFKYLYNGRNLELEIVDTIMDRYRDGKIPIDKFELSYSDFSLISQLIDKWLDIALQNGIKSVSIKSREQNERVKIQAPTLEHLTYDEPYFWISIPEGLEDSKL
ncbi:hypothetical protein KY289_020909 [Solanum tuberosum]|nr:hypothetical protein KY289_020909 [Solanum tuberosum]